MIDNIQDTNENQQAQPVKTEDFGAMLNESFTNEKAVVKGDVVEGAIISINNGFIFVNIGGKKDAYAEIGEYMDNKGNLTLQIGDILKGFVVRITDSDIVISKSLNRSHGNKRLVKEAFAGGIPVSGKVLAQVKGGYSVDVFGVRAFCPVSQVDLRPSSNADDYLGKTFNFMITEMEDSRNIIVSRKGLLQKENSDNRERLNDLIQLGSTVKGVVTRVTTFGAFVDLGGIEGLLHISEFSWIRIENAADVLKQGDELEVKIIKKENDKISLSLKALQDNPLEAAFADLEEGKIVTCRVLRHENFGSFVELQPGVEGLIPISQMCRGRKINHPSDVLNLGDTVDAMIIRLVPEERKISLSLLALQKDVWEDIDTLLTLDTMVEGRIESVNNFGAFINLQDGLTGLLPAGKIKRANMKLSKLNIGEIISLKVVEIDKTKKRISLEPENMPEMTPRDEQQAREQQQPRDSRDQRDPRDHREPRNDRGRRSRSDEEWKQFANQKREVPEDNPFRNL